MTLVRPDLSQVADEIVPGEYRVRIVDAEDGEYRTGTKYLKWALETFDEPDPKNNGRRLWYTTPYTGKGVFILQRFYKAVMGRPMNPEVPEFDTEEFIGKEVKVSVQLNDRGYPEVVAVQQLD